MAILPIYTYGQPVLRKRAKAVKEVTGDLRKFVENMFETMYHASGVGLAANQVGSLDRVLVLDVTDVDDKEHEGVGEAAHGTVADASKPTKLVMINPEVLSSQGSWKMEEGCLSIPEIREDVERAETIRVRYRDLDFEQQELEADGFLARVMLHEIDHLNGILFIDHIGTVKRKMLNGRLNKIQRGEMETRYPVLAAEPRDVPSK